uniref:Serine-threonine/tyrosine-protein kinase catalytic domain-containing protein n=1 Tax=Panagrolaimus davidi TaxID=227884 RepID=A0A914PWP6_9BILA
MRIFLEEGNRLEKPAATPEFVFELMLSCWKEEPNDRPSFSEIGSFFYGLLENETRGYGYLAIRSEVFGGECIH